MSRAHAANSRAQPVPCGAIVAIRSVTDSACAGLARVRTANESVAVVSASSAEATRMRTDSVSRVAAFEELAAARGERELAARAAAIVGRADPALGTIGRRGAWGAPRLAARAARV